MKQSWVDTDDLRNQSLWKDNMNAKPKAFKLFGGTRSSQSAAAATNERGIMFFGLVATNEIACWNTQNKFEGNNLVRLAKVCIVAFVIQLNLSDIDNLSNKIYGQVPLFFYIKFLLLFLLCSGARCLHLVLPFSIYCILCTPFHGHY